MQQKLIAEKAGVSKATVSRVFTQNAHVMPATVERVRNAMRELGYDEDLISPFKYNQNLKTVLVDVGDITNDFLAKVTLSIHNVLYANGYNTILCNSNFNSELEIRRMHDAIKARYAGIIMVTAVESDQLIEFLEQTKTIPIVFVNRYVSCLDLDVVRCDNYQGGYMAGRYLIDNGHRKIAFLGSRKDSIITRDRLRGFAFAMQDSSLQLSDEDIYYGDNTRSSGRKFASKLFENNSGHTAIFATNDYMAAGVAHYLYDIGKDIPEDFSIICFDDSPLVGADSLDITSVSCDPFQMGESAAETFLKRISNPQGEKVRIVYSPHYTIRSSVKNLNES